MGESTASLPNMRLTRCLVSCVSALVMLMRFLTDYIVGMFLITFFHCLRVLVWEDGHIKSWRRLHWKMLVASLLMFIFASLDVAFGLRHNIEAFVYFQGGAIEDFERLSNWVNVMKMVDYVGQTFVGDAILVCSSLIVESQCLFYCFHSSTVAGSYIVGIGWL
jgi:hypothetical protein